MEAREMSLPQRLHMLETMKAPACECGRPKPFYVPFCSGCLSRVPTELKRGIRRAPFQRFIPIYWSVRQYLIRKGRIRETA